jgi:hypothetical protein
MNNSLYFCYSLLFYSKLVHYWTFHFATTIDGGKISKPAALMDHLMFEITLYKVHTVLLDHGEIPSARHNTCGTVSVEYSVAASPTLGVYIQLVVRVRFISYCNGSGQGA